MSLLSLDQIKTLYDDLRGRIEDGGSVINFLPVDNASGSIASFPDGADNVPVKSLIAQITPIQDLHGQSAPYPAGGMGNYFDEDTLYASFKTGNNAFSGTASAINMVQFDIPQELVGQELTFSVHISSYAATSVRAYATAGGTGVNGNTGVAPFWSSVTFTPTSTSDKVQITYGSSGAGITVFDSVQLEVGSSRTTWHPYSNICPISGWTGANIHVADGENPHVIDNVYPIDWTDEAGTVYGGTLTYIGGGKYSLQATHKGVDMGSLTWTYNSAATFPFTAPAADATPLASTSSIPAAICSMFKPVSATAAADEDNCFGGWITSAGYAGKVAVKASDYTSGATFTTAVTGQTLVYPLATLPDPIILDAEDVKTLLGDNNIFVDTGDVSVDYRADIALYIQKVVNA